MAFKICAIGCGAMATTGHGPSFQRYAQEHPDVELAACCDLDAEKAELADLEKNEKEKEKLTEQELKQVESILERTELAQLENRDREL